MASVRSSSPSSNPASSAYAVASADAPLSPNPPESGRALSSAILTGRSTSASTTWRTVTKSNTRPLKAISTAGASLTVAVTPCSTVNPMPSECIRRGSSSRTILNTPETLPGANAVVFIGRGVNDEVTGGSRAKPMAAHILLGRCAVYTTPSVPGVRHAGASEGGFRGRWPLTARAPDCPSHRPSRERPGAGGRSNRTLRRCTAPRCRPCGPVPCA